MKRKKMIGMLWLTVFIIAGLIGLPVHVSAASLTCTKWEVGCSDAGKTKNVKVNGLKNGMYVSPNGNKYKVVWKSNNKKIATVDNNGKIKVIADKTGTAEITAYALIMEMTPYGERGYRHSLGTCKVKVSHDYKKKTEQRQPSKWQVGGTVHVCRCGKEKITNKKNYHYTEEDVKKEIENIVQMCPFSVSWFDYDGKLHHKTGYQTPEDYFEWLVKNKKYPKSILTKKTTVTEAKKYRGRNGQNGSEAGCHIFEVLLSGYQDYQCIYECRSGKEFDFDKNLKAGDILVEYGEYSIFKEYQYNGENGEDIRMVVYDINDGTFTEDWYYVSGVDVYRLPNYK